MGWEQHKLAKNQVSIILSLVAFIALGVTYSIVTPVFEAPDEIQHFFYVKHLADGGGLPRLDPTRPVPLWGQEGGQPPLYYALAAALIAPVDTSDALRLFWQNPHANVGDPLRPDNKNRIIHTDREAWPYRGAALAIHLIRCLSVLLGAGTVWLVYGIAWGLLGRPALALATAALTAFNPQFLFISGAVSNDGLVIFLSALAVWLLLRIRRGATTDENLVQTPIFMTILLGLVLGLAALTKLGGLALWPLAAGVLAKPRTSLAVGLRHRTLRRTLLDLTLVFAVALAVAGWWYLRNWQLYGDPTGLNRFLEIVGRRDHALGWRELLGEFEGLRISYWALFGWFNVPLPTWVYRVLDGFSLAALLGLPVAFLRRPRTFGPADLWRLLLPVAWIGLSLASLVRWTLLTTATQGRLLFPAIWAISLLLIVGWDAWSPFRRTVGYAGRDTATGENTPTSRGLRSLELVRAIFRTVAHAGRAATGDENAWSTLSGAPPGFGGAQSKGAGMSSDAPASFDSVRQTTPDSAQDASAGIFRTVAHAGRGPSTALRTSATADESSGGGSHAAGASGMGARPAGTDSPRSRGAGGAGIFRTVVHAGRGATTDENVTQAAGLRHGGQSSGLPHKPISRTGALWLAVPIVPLALLAILCPFLVIRPAYARPPLLTAGQIPPTAHRADVTHAGALRLLAYELPQETIRPGERLPVTLYWQSVVPTDQDLSVFVHLLGPGGASAGQLNSFPGLGAYPTSLLRPGDLIKDTYPVPVAVNATAPALLRVDVGLYQIGVGGEVGLSAADSAGQPASGQIGAVRLLPHRPPAYEIAHPMRFDLDGQAVLLGYDLPKPGFCRPGDTIELTLYWQAQARMVEDYHVFVHLVGPDGQAVAQGDKAPLDGDWPTWAWEPGYPVRDVYPIRLPETLAPGVYELRVGLYRLSDGWRVPVQGPAGRVRDAAMILDQVEVR